MVSIWEQFLREGWDAFGRQIVVGVDVYLWQVVLTISVVLGAVHLARRYGRIPSRESLPEIMYTGTGAEPEGPLERVFSRGPLREVFYGTYTEEAIERYDPPQRLFYWGVGVATIVLFVSGFALLEEGSLGRAPLVSWLWWHVLSAVVLTGAVAIHIFTASIRGDFWSMWPTREDLRNAGRSLKNFLGRVREYPRFGKYSPTSQTLHWLTAVFMLVLIVTGIVMWRTIRMPWWEATQNPFGLSVATSGLVYAIHGIAAGLVLGTLVLHAYFGLRRWDVSRSIFTGTISRGAFEDYYDPSRWKPAGIENPAKDGGQPSIETSDKEQLNRREEDT